MSRTSARVPVFWNISRRLSAVILCLITVPAERLTSTVTSIRGILAPMSPSPLASLLALLLWLGPDLQGAAKGPPSPEALRHRQLALLAIINDERAAAGAPPLRLLAALSQVAQENDEEAR